MSYEHLKTLSQGLRFRLMLWNAGVVLLIVLITLAALRQGVRYTLLHESDVRLIQDLKEVEMGIVQLDLTLAGIRAAAHGRTDSEAGRLLAELNRKAAGHAKRGWFIQMFDKQGREIWSSTNTPDLRSILPRVENFDPVTFGDYRVVTSLSTGEGYAPVILRVGISNTFLKQDMAGIDRLVAMVGLFAAVVALLAGYWLTDRAIHPLHVITSTASRLRPRRLEERLPIRGTGDEIDSMSHTINGLLDSIAAYLDRRHDFLANSAHELRTPIAAIRSTAEVALAGTRSKNEYEELLEEVMEECGTLEGLVNQLLLLAETEDDGPAAEGTQINLTEIVERSVDMFAGVAEYKGIQLSRNEAPALFVDGIAHHLRQVINNLLDNATKFTPSGGSVRVHLEAAPGGQIELRVADTGIGVPSADLPDIFERFFRGDRSRSHELSTRGTGLGLSICRAVVQAHRGDIAAESTPGQGTTFIVALPPSRHPAPHEQDPQPTALAGT